MASLPTATAEPITQPPVVMATAVAGVAMPTATAVPISQPYATAQPVQVQGIQPQIAQYGYVAQGQVVLPQGGSDFTPGQGYTPVVPHERWRSELCDCCAPGCGICCAAWCCPFVTGPQLYQKVLAKMGACKKYGAMMLTIWLVYQVAGSVLRVTPADVDGEFNIMWAIWQLVTLVTGILWLSIGTFVLSAARRRIREKDRIPVAGCGESEDCCCSFWCSVRGAHPGRALPIMRHDPPP